MWIPAAQGQEESTSCIFVEHSEFFSGTTMVKRTFTEVSTRIKWELISGTRTEAGFQIDALKSASDWLISKSGDWIG